MMLTILSFLRTLMLPSKNAVDFMTINKIDGKR